MNTEFFTDLEDYIEKLMSDSGIDSITIRKAKLALMRSLIVTGHIPAAYSIARGAGYCSFYARLCEAVGASGGYLRDKIVGKGSDIHKIVGLTALNLFMKHEYDPSSSLLLSRLEEVVDELEKERLIREDDEDKLLETIEISYLLLSKLFMSLPQICSALGVNVNNLFPIVEQQFLDYDLHIRGSPDLILEDQKEKKAIVIEWKTSPRPSSLSEKAQVICYALLEAKRLGYGKGKIRPGKELINVILGKLVDNGVEGVKVLPVIIRPIQRGELEPHPLLAPSSKVIERYQKMEKILADVLVEAQHLTMLLTNQERITGTKPDMFLIPLSGRKNVKINILRYTPRQLRRGKPREQTKYPCAVNEGKTPICDLQSACRFYYARDIGEREEYERILWGLRYQVFDEKERSLLIYKALHHIFEQYSKNEILMKFKSGNGIMFVANFPPSVSFVEKIFSAFQSKLLRGKILIRRVIYDHYGTPFTEDVEKKVEILDKVEVEGEDLVGSREIRDYEKDNLYVINEGIPVFITPLDGITPLLSINLFGRVDEIDVENGRVKYIIGIPSKLLNYQKLLFIKILKMNKLFQENLLMVEADVDLTRMDLNALDALQRFLKETAESNMYSEEMRKEFINEANQIREGLERIYWQEDPDKRSLGELLRKLIG